MSGLEDEIRILWAGAVAYMLAGSISMYSVRRKNPPERAVLLLLSAGLVLHGIAIAMRWHRLGHGPFITMFEILSSNVWSLTLIFTLVYWRIRPIRPSAALVLPILFVMLCWLLVSNPGKGFFPPTYDTSLLYIHILLGKIFMGSLVVAVGLAGVILLRKGGFRNSLARMPDDNSLEELAYRFMAIALVFDTLMLISGAIWAQDAWGRYWAWDSLESWSFVTWLLLGFAIHARMTLRPVPAIAASMVCLVFALAFLTFFGVPFISTAPHKGAI